MIIVDVWQRRENESSATFVNTNPIAFYFEKKKKIYRKKEEEKNCVCAGYDLTQGLAALGVFSGIVPYTNRSSATSLSCTYMRILLLYIIIFLFIYSVQRTQNPILVVVVVVASFILSFNFPVDTKLGYHILPSFK